MVGYRAKVTIESLYEVVYEKSISTKMNDTDLCFKVVQGHVNHFGVNISKITRARDFQFGMRLCNVRGLGTDTFQRRISKTRKLWYRKDDRAMRAT